MSQGWRQMGDKGRKAEAWCMVAFHCLLLREGEDRGRRSEWKADHGLA